MEKTEKEVFVETGETGKPVESGEHGENEKEIRDISEEDLLDIFVDSEYSYLLDDVIKRLSEIGYSNPGTSILYAIQDGIICIDDIEDNGAVYLAFVEGDEEGKLEYI